MLKIFTVDAFTDKMFSGNPAAVCLLDQEIDEKLMLGIAAEMNLSETAFVKKLNDREGFSLRWFTPRSEVELCGHATLSAAHILWQEKIIPSEDEAVFFTVFKGKLTAKKTDEGIELNFPVNIPAAAEPFAEFESALGAIPVNLSITDNHYLAEINSVEELINIKPDFKALEKLDKYGTIITTASDNENYDFVSRFFAPGKGIPEDPVTGSAHCVLTPYWSKKLNKTSLRAFQASERGGYLNVRLNDDRVLITGNAVTVLAGQLFI
ncbi:MAG TPA: PhzF family phenazine biosynthesis protein [Ignavibacteria bacterium]|nr:PhzF family phenazine biosynthesis protein [Ignavibacteria bacterium]